MTDYDKKKPTILAFSETIGTIEGICFDLEHGEIFALCFEDVFVVNLSGELIITQKLPGESRVIGQQRTPNGWQYLCQESSGLTNYSLSVDQNSEVKLLESILEESAQTAAWSPCGRYVAVGSDGITFSVWNTDTGELVMQKSLNWGNEDPFIIPPTLSVIGWSKTGKEIITSTGSMISNNVLIWDFPAKRLRTVIN
ncbi:MAG: WD40 repeat domain-containing protein [Gammaproteobacteria bacterium]|nr:WD40 repeat domain-containing protein [Gammaproteobacteria bacterium]